MTARSGKSRKEATFNKLELNDAKNSPRFAEQRSRDQPDIELTPNKSASVDGSETIMQTIQRQVAGGRPDDVEALLIPETTSKPSHQRQETASWPVNTETDTYQTDAKQSHRQPNLDKLVQEDELLATS